MNIETFFVYNIILDDFIKNKIVNFINDKIRFIKLQTIKNKNNLILLS